MPRKPKRIGRQEPTQSYILPYEDTKGLEAVKIYNKTGRKALPWQEQLMADICAVGKDGLWVHQKFGYSVPRRNGKNEIVAMRELYGLVHGEIMCHTAHRTTTSSTAWSRLVMLLKAAGYVELGRPKKDEEPPAKSFRTNKQHGLEDITVTNGGRIVFRTRTANGGLGEGFDLLVIDEAQEYTNDQESALIYTVTDSKNPQTLFCGTPPTATSAGTVFSNMRLACLAGDAYDSGWAEWSIPNMTEDLLNVDLWYETNPSMGYHLDERKVRSEIKKDAVADFNIQRLGVWLRYNQRSAISRSEWDAAQVDHLPELLPERFFGIKYGRDGMNVALAVASKTVDGKIFVEAIDCVSVRNGPAWMLDFLRNPKAREVMVDGSFGKEEFPKLLSQERVKIKCLEPSFGELVVANSNFERAIGEGTLVHCEQPSVTQVVCNCEHRALGNNGGFAFSSILLGADIALLDAMMLAHYICSVAKERKKQHVGY